MKVHKKDLLEWLRREVGCNYISDLRYEPYNRPAIQKMNTLHREEFGEEEWLDAIRYLEKGEGVSVRFRM